MTEKFKYNVIKKLVETNGNKNSAALKIGCSKRHINCMIASYKEKGKAYFKHGNKGRKPVNATEEKKIQAILTLYDNK